MIVVIHIDTEDLLAISHSLSRLCDRLSEIEYALCQVENQSSSALMLQLYESLNPIRKQLHDIEDHANILSQRIFTVSEVFEYCENRLSLPSHVIPNPNKSLSTDYFSPFAP